MQISHTHTPRFAPASSPPHIWTCAWIQISVIDFKSLSFRPICLTLLSSDFRRCCCFFLWCVRFCIRVPFCSAHFTNGYRCLPIEFISSKWKWCPSLGRPLLLLLIAAAVIAILCVVFSVCFSFRVFEAFLIILPRPPAVVVVALSRSILRLEVSFRAIPFYSALFNLLFRFRS